MLNSEDPLLSSSPRDFPHQRSVRRQNRLLTPIPTPLQQWTHDALQVFLFLLFRIPLFLFRSFIFIRKFVIRFVLKAVTRCPQYF